MVDAYTQEQKILDLRTLIICKAIYEPYQSKESEPFDPAEHLPFLKLAEETPEERGERMTQKVLALAGQLGAKRVET